MPHPSHYFCIAPMIDLTDRHCRYLLRLISPHARLYSEMITTGAILHGDREYLLSFDDAEHPLALQLGGSEPRELAACAAIGAEWGYDEINLNVGCPSDRVQSGRFGACLMAEPGLVADCVSAMREVVNVPVTVKHRLGIDDLDSYDHLAGFVQRVANAGCDVFIVHARKAWLQGLSPKENREVPPLLYERVHRLKADFPDIGIVLNGGLDRLDQIERQLEIVDGVMVGREAYQNPWLLASVERRLFGSEPSVPDRHALARAARPYIAAQLAKGVRLHHITRHMLGLFQGRPGARRWRRYLSEHAHAADAGVGTIDEALALVPAAPPHANGRDAG